MQPSPAYTDWGGRSPSAPAPSRGGRLGGRPAVFLVVLLVLALMGGSLFYLHMRGSSRLPANSTVALSIGFAKGDVRHYRTTIAIHGSIVLAQGKLPFDMKMQGTMVWRVQKISAQGIGSVYVSLQHATLTENGVTGPMPRNWMTLRVAPDGRILSSCTFGGPGPGYIGELGIPGSTELAPVLPDGRVAPGTSWTKSFAQTFPGGKNALRFTTKNTYVRSQPVGTVSAAVVRTSATIPLNLTVDLKKLFAEYGEAHVLGAFHPLMRYKGSIALAMTSWVDSASRQILREAATTRFDVALTASGMPARNRLPGGGLRLIGTETLSSSLLNSSNVASGGSGSGPGSSPSW